MQNTIFSQPKGWFLFNFDWCLMYANAVALNFLRSAKNGEFAITVRPVNNSYNDATFHQHHDILSAFRQIYVHNLERGAVLAEWVEAFGCLLINLEHTHGGIVF
jgi:hypothetical protein